MKLSLRYICCFASAALLLSIALVYAPPAFARVDLTGELKTNDACNKATDSDGNDACHAVTSSSQGGALTPMVIVAYVAVGFIIKGGYMYMVSSGSPDAMAKAKNTIRDALIGLVIAISAAAIVDMVAGVI